jgi:hypothetical protein
MLGALIIVFREVIEAGLIVGIVMAAARGVVGRGRWVTVGVVGGVFGASIVAVFAGPFRTRSKARARNCSTRACLASLCSC